MKTLQELINPKTFNLADGKRFYVGKIPAFEAQKIVLKCAPVLTGGNISALPQDTILELLSYCAIDNQSKEAIVLENEDLVNMLVPSPLDLIKIELKSVEVNFGFLLDGSIGKVLEDFQSKSATKG